MTLAQLARVIAALAEKYPNAMVVSPDAGTYQRINYVNFDKDWKGPDHTGLLVLSNGQFVTKPEVTL